MTPATPALHLEGVASGYKGAVVLLSLIHI